MSGGSWHDRAGMAATSESDSLLQEFARLSAQLDAWTDAWQQRRAVGGAAVATLFSCLHTGEPLATRLEQRLLLAKARLEGKLADLAGRTAIAIARLAGDADVATTIDAVRQHVTAVGRSDEGFASKRAELEPLVAVYRRLATALGDG